MEQRLGQSEKLVETEASVALQAALEKETDEEVLEEIEKGLQMYNLSH